MDQQSGYLTLVIFLLSVFISLVTGDRLTCKYTKPGTEYDGTLLTTKSGKTCQRWDKHMPLNGTSRVPYFPDGSAKNAANYCRNPTMNQDGPWCYTADSPARWEHCNVSFCECKRLQLGKNYQGLVSVSSSGRTCQRWDSQTPHRHTRNRISKFPDESLFEAANYCRNPDDEAGGPWCYTTDRARRWEYCNISFCDDAARPKTCKITQPGREYEGTLSVTSSGLTCQRWDSQHPHRHRNYFANKFAERDASAAVNYCRNPDRMSKGPWCYTTNRRVRWEYCDIKFCECKMHELGKAYRGKLSVTRNGKTCQRWDSMSPHRHSLWYNTLFPGKSVTSAANFCRNPDNEVFGPWCYTTDPRTRWEYCNVSFCDFARNTTWSSAVRPSELPKPETSNPPPPTAGCRHTVLGKEYTGNLSRTESGLTCQRWDRQFPHAHMNFHWHKFPDKSLNEASNFCRNPDNEPLGPWCYTTSQSTRWEYCYVPMCECKKTPLGASYAGKTSTSKSGLACKWWADQVKLPRVFKNLTVDMFPDGSAEKAQTFCRNPDDKPGGPWCFVAGTDKSAWEHCNIPLCGKKNTTKEVKKCRTSVMGLDYLGTLSVTVSGKRCAAWHKQTQQKYFSHQFPDDGILSASNYCRNPTRRRCGPWCHTDDPVAPWEYCNVPMCGKTNGGAASAGKGNCKKTMLGKGFMGHTATTISGRTCQEWQKQYPHRHKFTQVDHFPDRSMVKVENFCRNPDGEPCGPWCYTTDPRYRWDYCDTPLCQTTGHKDRGSGNTSASCKTGTDGKNYLGTQSVTFSGKTCSKWYKHAQPSYTSRQFPDNGIRSASNYCRNPTGLACGPWCHTNDPAVPWEYCDIPKCGKTNQAAASDGKDGCKTTMLGKDYSGNISVTVSGRTCQQWNSQHPHRHKFTQGGHFREGSVLAVKNFCRNPDGEPCGPWCFTTDPMQRWEYCDILSCKTIKQKGKKHHLAGSHAKNPGVNLAAILVPILLLLVIVIGLALLLFIRRRRSGNVPESTDTPSGPFENPLYADPVQFKRLQEET